MNHKNLSPTGSWYPVKLKISHRELNRLRLDFFCNVARAFLTAKRQTEMSDLH
jgi:hypothetical protein